MIMLENFNKNLEQKRGPWTSRPPKKDFDSLSKITY